MFSLTFQLVASKFALSIGYLKSQMPTLMGKEKKQQKLINDLPNVFRSIMKKYNLAAGDFPVRLASVPYFAGN